MATTINELKLTAEKVKNMVTLLKGILIGSVLMAASAQVFSQEEVPIYKIDPGSLIELPTNPKVKVQCQGETAPVVEVSCGCAEPASAFESTLYKYFVFSNGKISAITLGRYRDSDCKKMAFGPEFHSQCSMKK